MMKKLPVGLQNFPDFSLRNCVYVDKTMYIHKMLDAGGKAFFLSRPRRFGKSLLLTTIQAIFDGKQKLFEGLFIHDKISWETHPVILLDMGLLVSTSIETLQHSLTQILLEIAVEYDVQLEEGQAADMLRQLIVQLFTKTGRQVVLLVDEYDKPILDTIADLKLATEIRTLLQSFYTIIKSSGAAIHFVLLTGVSKISQTSIFSGLNNLYDISLDAAYAGICGYTQNELEDGFAEHITALTDTLQKSRQQILKEIKAWYNGYSWDGQTFLYNPFSVLLLLQQQRFLSHWFASGTPSFLLKLMKEKDDFSPLLLAEIEVPANFTDKQVLQQLDLVPLCFQTGYLTIKKANIQTSQYWLKIPNDEVKIALTETLLTDLTGKPDYELHSLARQMKVAFEREEIPGAIEKLRILFSQVSYNTHVPSEAHYHALFQLTMNLAGINQRSEVYNSLGRADSVLTFGEVIYIVEIKYVDKESDVSTSLIHGMEQIKSRRYYEPYMGQGNSVNLLALTFGKGILSFSHETI